MHPSEREFPKISNSLPVQWMHETWLLAATFNAIIAVDFLAFFFRSLLNEDPWWVSLNEPVNNDATTCITHYLGFDYHIGVQFLCMAGLSKVGNSRNLSATVVVKEEWDKIHWQREFVRLAESINQTSISNKRYYFIHFRRKKESGTLPYWSTKGWKQ